MGKLEVLSPANGELIPNSKISDETFSKNMMGQGFGIVTFDKVMCAPISGEITLISGHAYSIKNPEGVEILIHMGIDTVEIPSDKKSIIFNYVRKVGDKVNAKDPIVNVDWDAIKALGFDITTPVVILSESIGNKSVSIEAIGPCSVGDVAAIVE
ncbi:MAG: PTS glucose transporter subunit IIA [Mycoplasma sp.]|nr:PTS glucose transporter subunit IIA [Mycoplasma sp.]